MSEELNKEIVQSCLKKVLESRVFEKSERARNLLDYLVHQELEGNGAELKAFTIAVDVFDKDETFEATTDPLVRVHAGRLRELLAAYYESEGVSDRVEFSIPLGGYRPVIKEKAGLKQEGKPDPDATEFEVADSGADPDLAKNRLNAELIDELGPIINRPNPGLKRQIQYIWALSILLSIVAGFLLFYLYSLSNDKGRIAADSEFRQQVEMPASSLPVIRVLTDLDDEQSRVFGERFLTALSRFDTITTVKLGSKDVLNQRAENWDALDYSFVVSKITNVESSTELYKLELISLEDGRILRSEEFPQNIWESDEIDQLIARKLGAAATPEGVVYADIAAKGGANQVIECLLLVRQYYGLSNPAKHKKAYDCTNSAPDDQPNVEGLLKAIHGGLMAEAAGKGYFYSDLPEKRDDALGLALTTALAGFDAAPLSARAAREVGFVHSWQGAFSQMTEWFEQANILNPYDSSIAASFGYGLVLTGEYEKAAKVMKKAIASSARQPNWWRLYGSLALLMTGKIDEAEEMIAPIGLAKRSLYYTLLNTVFAYQKKDRIRAAFLVRELKERYPKFAANPEGSFQRRHFPKELIDTLVTGLENSGL